MGKNLRFLSDYTDLAISAGIDRVDVPATIDRNDNDCSVGGLPGARVIPGTVLGHFWNVGAGQRVPAGTRRVERGGGDAGGTKVDAAESKQLTGVQNDQGRIPTCERHWARGGGGQGVRRGVKNVGVRDAPIYCSLRARIAANDKNLAGRRNDRRTRAELVADKERVR